MRISVRELAAFAGCGGDLHSGSFSLLRGIDGIRAHRRIQEAAGGAVQTEVSLTLPRTVDGETVSLHGRVDLLRAEPGGGVCIEEIKTTRAQAGERPPDFGEHRMQALLYAWMWLELNGGSVRFCIHYVPPDRGEGWRVLEIPDPAQLRAEAEAALQRYAAFAREQRAWCARRNQRLQTLLFPFTALRPGQQTMMDAVARTFSTGGRLDVEAPTGIGKTFAVLVPALRALGGGTVQTLMLATCRNSGKSMIETTLSRLVEEQQLPLRVLTLVAKDRCCNATGSPCDCSRCPLALGFYDRLAAGLADLRQQPQWTREVWMAVAARHRLCPFAFLMHAAREADVLLGDVNYVLDPGARLAFLFEARPGGIGLLLDEAHHLPDRARDMFSASLDLHLLQRALRSPDAQLRSLSALRPVRRAAQQLFPAAEGEAPMTGAPPRELAEACRRAALELEASLGTSPPAGDDLRTDLFRMLQGFWLNVERHSAAHVTYLDGQTLCHYCRDASAEIRTVVDSLHAAVFFSATLSPMPAFQRLSGAAEGSPALVLPSPYDPRNLHLEIEDRIPVVYRARDAKLYDTLARRIRQFLEASPGKTLVFLPSFGVLEEIRSRLPQHDLWFGEVLAQTRGMQETETEAFLRPFREGPGPLTALAVLGGALNEGIDLPGDQLQAVVVVSIGLPALTPARELLRAYHEAQGEDGFVYAYTLPGLTRVRQALGRVIRGPEDTGRALLIDPRFRHPIYAPFLGATGAD